MKSKKRFAEWLNKKMDIYDRSERKGFGNKEFYLYSRNKKSPIHITFKHPYNIHECCSFELSRKEWKDLLVFLGKTISDKKNIFQNFLIDKNIISQSTSQDIINENRLLEAIFSKKSKEVKENKKYRNICKRYYLDYSICIQKGDVSINLERDKFIRLRNFCLKYSSGLSKA